MIESVPPNLNLLPPHGFRFNLRRSPGVNFFCQRANIPGMSIAAAEMATPLTNIPYPGEQPSFEELRITFLVDEDMGNYLEIFRWMSGLAAPRSTDQYVFGPVTSGKGPMADGSLFILDAKMQPNFEVVFFDLWPTSIAGIDFDVTPENPEYVLATAEFRYSLFDLRRVKFGFEDLTNWG